MKKLAFSCDGVKAHLLSVYLSYWMLNLEEVHDTSFNSFYMYVFTYILLKAVYLIALDLAIIAMCVITNTVIANRQFL